MEKWRNGQIRASTHLQAVSHIFSTVAPLTLALDMQAEDRAVHVPIYYYTY